MYMNVKLHRKLHPIKCTEAFTQRNYPVLGLNESVIAGHRYDMKILNIQSTNVVFYSNT